MRKALSSIGLACIKYHSNSRAAELSRYKSNISICIWFDLLVYFFV